MPARAKINPIVLHKYLRDGHSQAEAARHFGVNESSISRALKRVSAKVVNQSLEMGHQIAESNINMAQHFGKAVQLLEEEIEWTRKRCTEAGQEGDAIRARAQESMIKMLAEKRHQVETALRIQQAVDVGEQMAEFQAKVVEFINQLDDLPCPHCQHVLKMGLKQRFVLMLRQASMVRNSVTFHP